MGTAVLDLNWCADGIVSCYLCEEDDLLHHPRPLSGFVCNHHFCCSLYAPVAHSGAAQALLVNATGYAWGQ